jgi:hypothetical protein
MPPLKWANIGVVDTAHGVNVDIVDGGSPIMLVANGIYGPDGMPYPLKGNPEFSGAWNNNGARPVGVGNAGMLLFATSGTPVNDTAVESGSCKYVAGVTKNYQVFHRSASVLNQGAPHNMRPEAVPVPGSYGNQIDSLATIFNQICLSFNSGQQTPPCLVVAGDPSFFNVPLTSNGYPVKDVAGMTVTANIALQGGGATMSFANRGAFILYVNATNWFLTKLQANATWSAPTDIIVDPQPLIGFVANQVERYPVWGGADLIGGINSMLGTHASGTQGAYMGSQCCEYFQGRIVMANMLYAPKYTAVADINDYRKILQKPNRLTYTILNGEKPTLGPFTTSSDGLTQLQFPWSIEPNNWIDVEGVGNILQLANMGDNQLFIMGDQGCARITGYLTTAVAGVDANTYSVSAVFKSPPIRNPNAAVVTKRGVFYAGRYSIYLYDGNGISDVLNGVGKQFFPPWSNTSGFELDGKYTVYAGILSDEYIYFSWMAATTNIGGNQSSNFVMLLNVSTGKWSIMTDQTSFTMAWGPSVRPGFVWNTNFNAPANSGIVQIDQSVWTQPKNTVELYNAGKNQGGYGDGFSGGSPNGNYIIAFRPVGKRGVPKRFRHIVINYGLSIVTGSPVANVRVLFGADMGWPQTSITKALLIGTLTPGPGTLGGNLPNQEQRFAIDDIQLQNVRNVAAGSQLSGLSDCMTVIIELLYGGGTAHLEIYNIDYSWMEAPEPNRLVMR